MRNPLKSFLAVLSVLVLLTLVSDAAVVIQSGASSDQLTIDATSKAARVSLYDPTGYALSATRTPVQFTATNFTAATSEGLVTLTPTRSYATAATGTSFTVTSSKRLRLSGMCVTTKNAGAAVQGVQIRLRVDPSSTCTTADPLVAVVGAGTASATANVVGSGCIHFDGGTGAIELSGSAQLCVSQIGTATAGNDFVVWGYEY